jgi:hypothetical protein
MNLRDIAPVLILPDGKRIIGRLRIKRWAYGNY